MYKTISQKIEDNIKINFKVIMYGELDWILVFPLLDSSPSVRMEELGFHWTYLREILYLITFRKCG